MKTTHRGWAMLRPLYFQLVLRPECRAVLLQWDKEAASELVGPQGFLG